MSTDTPNTLMDKMLDDKGVPPVELDQIIEGVVIESAGTAVYVDLPPHGTGIIYGREFLNARDILKNINVGDTVSAKVVEKENKDGYIELSLKEARQALIWAEAEKAIKNSEKINVIIKDANKGGLIINWQGIEGFLPASQLSGDHYPRVPDGDKDKILRELKKLIGETIKASIIAANPKEGKLIFSEKDASDENREVLVTKYEVGDELDCEVTGVVDFGVFLKIEDGLEGLVHISEIDWALVDDPRKMFKPGDKTKAKVIEIKDGKISLSIKALKENPWSKVEGKYKPGDVVSGVVIKHNKHGALVAVEEGVAGLVHLSDFDNDESKLRTTLELGKTYSFKITLFDAKEQRMTLAYQGV
jgi:small subunit ribosomal protein S1